MDHIVQLIQADGWSAVYVYPPGVTEGHESSHDGFEVDTIRLVAWALVEIDDRHMDGTPIRCLAGVDAWGDLHFPTQFDSQGRPVYFYRFLAPDDELNRVAAIDTIQKRLTTWKKASSPTLHITL